MKSLTTILGIFIIVQACDLQKKSNFIPLVPPDTPFIVGILEATADTVHHYSEVYVGTVSNPEGFEAEPVWTTPDIWWPVVNALVTRPVTRNDLKRTADTKAEVIVKGPLGTANETTVQFSHEGKGVYGDTQYELPLVAGETYELLVITGDGRRYTATTHIPELFEWDVPDSVTMELKFGRYTNGVYSEKDKELAKFPFTTGLGVGYIAIQSNSKYDYDNYDAPEGGFLFDNRGKFLREGSAYGIHDAFDFPEKRAVYVGWGQSADDPLRHSEDRWLSLSQLNISMSLLYYSIFHTFAGEADGRWDKQDAARHTVTLRSIPNEAGTPTS